MMSWQARIMAVNNGCFYALITRWISAMVVKCPVYQVFVSFRNHYQNKSWEMTMLMARSFNNCPDSGCLCSFNHSRSFFSYKRIEASTKFPKFCRQTDFINFHRSVFLGAQLPRSRHWARQAPSRYMNQCGLSSQTDRSCPELYWSVKCSETEVTYCHTTIITWSNVWVMVCGGKRKKSTPK